MIVLEQVSSETFGRHLPMLSLIAAHQLVNVVGERPGSVAMPSMSTWSGAPIFSCVQTTTKLPSLSVPQSRRPPRLPVAIWIQTRSPALPAQADSSRPSFVAL